MVRRAGDPPCPVCGERVLGPVSTRTQEWRDKSGRVRRKVIFLHSVCGAIEGLRRMLKGKRKAELREWHKRGLFSSQAQEELIRARVTGSR
jgi:hypothetical protein